MDYVASVNDPNMYKERTNGHMKSDLDADLVLPSSSEDSAFGEGLKYPNSILGLVVSASSSDRTCKIHWWSNGGNVDRLISLDTAYSTYNLMDYYQDSQFCFGDIVLWMGNEHPDLRDRATTTWQNMQPNIPDMIVSQMRQMKRHVSQTLEYETTTLVYNTSENRETLPQLSTHNYEIRSPIKPEKKEKYASASEISFDEKLPPLSPNTNVGRISVGMQVKVKDSVYEPIFGWGTKGVTNNTIGIVMEVREQDVVILRFDCVEFWACYANEIEIILEADLLTVGAHACIKKEVEEPSFGWGTKGVHSESIGVVTEISNGGVVAMRFECTDFWACYVHELQVVNLSPMSVGAIVRVKHSIAEPEFGWGTMGVDHNSVGKVVNLIQPWQINDPVVACINFENISDYWVCYAHELEVVPGLRSKGRLRRADRDYFIEPCLTWGPKSESSPEHRGENKWIGYVIGREFGTPYVVVQWADGSRTVEKPRLLYIEESFVSSDDESSYTSSSHDSSSDSELNFTQLSGKKDSRKCSEDDENDDSEWTTDEEFVLEYESLQLLLKKKIGSTWYGILEKYLKSKSLSLSSLSEHAIDNILSHEYPLQTSYFECVKVALNVNKQQHEDSYALNKSEEIQGDHEEYIETGSLKDKKNGDYKELVTPEKKKDIVESDGYLAKTTSLDSYGVFKILEHCPNNHRFIKEECNNPSKDFLKAIRKEYKILQTGLPQTTFVYTFEDRVNLFSICIEGPSATLYEGACFLFDVLLPYDYPHSPPQFHYISFTRGPRLNPNLYNEGKVCVSLLGTWNGREDKNEVWDAKNSTILQVVVSIQGIILNDKPYYNEAGYSKLDITEDIERESHLYSEGALIITLAHIHAMLVKPPSIWKDVILECAKKKLPMVLDQLTCAIQGRENLPYLKSFSVGAKTAILGAVQDFITTTLI
eukprot:UC4_evm7s1043